METTWSPEVKHYCRGVPILLVGDKTDLRGGGATVEALAKSGQKPVSKDEAVHVAHKIRADSYVECSAKENEGVDTVFQTAARAAISHRNKHAIVRKIKGRCLLL